MNIFVLGGSYFIGRRIASMLVQRGHDVTVLNRGLKAPLVGARHLQADRSSSDEMSAALASSRFDVLIDVSGQTPEHVRNAISALPSIPQRVVFVSSGAVYRADQPLPYSEGSRVGYTETWGEYGTNKLECENLWSAAAADSKASLLILRPPYLYGIGNPLDREQWFVSRVLNDRTILIPDDPDTFIQFLHVDDLARIVAMSIEGDDPVRGTFNVAAPDVLTFGALCELTGIALGRAVQTRIVDTNAAGITARQIFPFRSRSYSLDVQQMLNELVGDTGLCFPNTSAGWVETCVGIVRYQPKPNISPVEASLL